MNNDERSTKQVNYTRRGDGPPVILIHGIAASLHDWTDVAPSLAAQGYSTYALDLLGHGDSPKPEDTGSYHIESIYAHFRDWLQKLHLSEPPLLVGHSMGGYISLVHALRNPQAVRGLVLINPFYSPMQLSPVMRVMRRRPAMGEKALQVVPEWLIQKITGWDARTTSNLSARARRQIAIDYKRASPKFVYITREIPDLTPRLPEVETPALVIWGERDQTLQPASFPRLVQALPRSAAQAIPGCGHQPHIGRHALVSRLALDFFSNLTGPASAQAFQLPQSIQFFNG
jgi:pimeloyl-ACP methyl ester carboxylesterase